MGKWNDEEGAESIDEFGLTERQRKFADAYVIDCNATKAVIAAGIQTNYPPQAGRDLLDIPKVMTYIKLLRSRAAEVAGVTVIRNAQALTEIAYDRTGEVRASDKIKAVEVLNKMFGLNEAKKIDVTVVNDHEKLSDEELVELIERKRKQREALSE